MGLGVIIRVVLAGGIIPKATSVQAGEFGFGTPPGGGISGMRWEGSLWDGHEYSGRISSREFRAWL